VSSTSKLKSDLIEPSRLNILKLNSSLLLCHALTWIKHPYRHFGNLQPAAIASASVQNQRSPLEASIFVLEYQGDQGGW